MLTYHEGGYFAGRLLDAGVPIHMIGTKGLLRKVRAVRTVIRSLSPDVVLAFLPMPSLYAELAGIPKRQWGLVVGERSSTPDYRTFRVRFRRALHSLADAVVTNSHANRLMIEQTNRRLRGRVWTIYNAVDFEAFPLLPLPERSSGNLRVTIAASYQRLKNVTGWVRAMQEIRLRWPNLHVQTDWYGGRASAGRGADERQAAESLILQHGLENLIRLHEAETNIARRYAEAHVVALPSLYEGLPNVVCEGMAMGRPIAGSAVSDMGNLVEEGVTGTLFNPREVGSIAESVATLVQAGVDTLQEMGRRSFERARQLLDPDRVLTSYSKILESAAVRRPGPPLHWPDLVPDTALATLSLPCGS